MLTNQKDKAGTPKDSKKQSDKSRSINLPKAGAQSVYRTISLIRTVAEYNSQGARLSQIARKAGLPTATAYRILSVLVAEGFVGYDSMAKNYYLGVELFKLGSLANQFAIKDQFHSALFKVSQESEDTVYLFIGLGSDAVCIDMIEGKFPVHISTIGIGLQRPLGVGAAPLALLAFLPDEQVKKIILANKLRYPKYNNMSADTVRWGVERSRKLTYAYSESLVLEGIAGVGIPIYDRKGSLKAAISVGAISQRLQKKRREEIVTFVKSEIAGIKVD